jgi:hypothetical protein
MHLCFADDVLLFLAATTRSAKAINAVLQEFASLSGLSANPTKSSLYVANATDLQKEQLVECLQMKESQLPVRYLGVPLISRKLTAIDCGSLLEQRANLCSN